MNSLMDVLEQGSWCVTQLAAPHSTYVCGTGSSLKASGSFFSLVVDGSVSLRRDRFRRRCARSCAGEQGCGSLLPGASSPARDLRGLSALVGRRGAAIPHRICRVTARHLLGCRCLQPGGGRTARQIGGCCLAVPCCGRRGQRASFCAGLRHWHLSVDPDRRHSSVYLVGHRLTVLLSPVSGLSYRWRIYLGTGSP